MVLHRVTVCLLMEIMPCNSTYNSHIRVRGMVENMCCGRMQENVRM